MTIIGPGRFVKLSSPENFVFHYIKYSRQWVLIADARSFQAFAIILDWLTHLASISCWYQSDSRRDEYYLANLKLLYSEFQKYEVMTMPVVAGQPKKNM